MSGIRGFRVWSLGFIRFTEGKGEKVLDLDRELGVNELELWDLVIAWTLQCSSFLVLVWPFWCPPRSPPKMLH